MSGTDAHVAANAHDEPHSEQPQPLVDGQTVELHPTATGPLDMSPHLGDAPATRDLADDVAAGSWDLPLPHDHSVDRSPGGTPREVTRRDADELPAGWQRPVWPDERGGDAVVSDDADPQYEAAPSTDDELRLERESRSLVETLGGEPIRADQVVWQGETEFNERLVDAGEDPTEADSVLGYYEPETDRIYVRNAERSINRGALVHEMIHASQPQEARQAIPEPLNEGVTELLSRRLDPTSEQRSSAELLFDGRTRVNIPGLVGEASFDPEAGIEVLEDHGIYGDRIAAMKRLEQTVGADSIAQFWRSGDASQLRQLLDEHVSPGAWSRFEKAAARGDWREAEESIAGAPPE